MERHRTIHKGSMRQLIRANVSRALPLFTCINRLSFREPRALTKYFGSHVIIALLEIPDASRQHGVAVCHLLPGDGGDQAQ